MMSTKPAPRRLVTYSKGTRDRPTSKAPTARPSKPAKDDLYDFPESDEEAPRPSTVSRKTAVTPAKPAARNKAKDEDLYDFPGSGDDAPPASRPRSKAATPARIRTPAKPSLVPSQRGSTVKKASATKPPLRRGDDDIRKRKHANAFDTDKLKNPPNRQLEIPSRPVAPPSKPVTKANSAQSKITNFTAPQAKTPVKSTIKLSPTSAPVPPKQDKPSPVPKPSPKPRTTETPATSITATPRPQKKVRLIDTLASQKVETSGSESESDSEAEQNASTSAGGTDRTPRLTSRAPSQTPMSQSSVRYGKDARSRPGTLVNKKIKFTYSQARSFRQESQSQSQSQPQSLGAMMESMQESLVSSPSPGPEDEFDMDDDEDDIPKSGIKSLHELRRAGANSRFGDEMEDLMSRIGKPGRSSGSMRRNALIDLAQKLQRSDFAAQFRDHAARDTIVDDVGKETEIMSAFALGAALTIFLSSQNAPHMMRRLVEERIGKVLAMLLGEADDIDMLAKRRENNLSKMARTSVSQIRAHLMGMPIWHGCKLRTLSPRVVALRLLHILQCNLDSQSQSEVVKYLEAELSDTAETHAAEDSPDSINFVLVALILESESGVDTVALGRDQIARQAATSAQLLRKAIRRWPDDLGEVPAAIFKLSINTTNTELGARAFSDGDILSQLARCITEGLLLVQGAVAKGTLKEGLYDGLLLNMGVLINILEHCTASRKAMDDDSLSKLARLYIESRPAAMDADTEEKSKASVAVGYLAVVLGYLCLEERGRKAMGHGSQGSAMRNLTNSIQHFMELYRSVDTRVQELEGLVVDLQRYSR